MKKITTLLILTTILATACGSGLSGGITDEELGQGWYYAQEDEKKKGTPDNWVFLEDEDGENSKWIKPPVENMMDY